MCVRSVCAKFGMDGGNGCGDMSRAKVLRVWRTDGQTDGQPVEVLVVNAVAIRSPLGSCVLYLSNVCLFVYLQE